MSFVVFSHIFPGARGPLKGRVPNATLNYHVRRKLSLGRYVFQPGAKRARTGD